MDDFEPLDYLYLAESIINSISRGRDIPISKTSAVLRTAISRSYYAAFLIARENLRAMGVNIPHDSQVHKFVANKLGERNRFLKAQLINLRDMRNRADYDLPPAYSVTERDAKYALATAQNIISMIRNNSLI